MILTGKNFILNVERECSRAFVIPVASLQNFDPTDKDFTILVLCSTRDIARHLVTNYEGVSQYMGKISMFTCGMATCEHGRVNYEPGGQSNITPQIVVSTPKCVYGLLMLKKLKVDKVKQFLLYDGEEMFIDPGKCLSNVRAMSLDYDLVPVQSCVFAWKASASSCQRRSIPPCLPSNSRRKISNAA